MQQIRILNMNINDEDKKNSNGSIKDEDKEIKKYDSSQGRIMND